MIGNLDRKIVGKCSECGGVVSLPLVSHSVVRPVPTCEKCGATADVTANLPVIPMKHKVCADVFSWKTKEGQFLLRDVPMC